MSRSEMFGEMFKFSLILKLFFKIAPYVFSRQNGKEINLYFITYNLFVPLNYSLFRSFVWFYWKRYSTCFLICQIHAYRYYYLLLHYHYIYYTFFIIVHPLYIQYLFRNIIPKTNFHKRLFPRITNSSIFVLFTSNKNITRHRSKHVAYTLQQITQITTNYSSKRLFSNYHIIENKFQF